MKSIRLILGLCVVLFTGCDFSDDDSFNIPSPASLPDAAYDYINANYADYYLESIDIEDLCDNQLVFEVELEDGPGPDVELYFDLDGNFLFSATDIALSDLPGVVTTAIENEFPGYQIDEDDAQQLEYADGTIEYYVELDANSGSDIKAFYSADGTLICTHDSNDDDDDDNSNPSVSLDSIPASVLDFIEANYSGYQIQSAETEDICDDVLVYEIELEDGPGPDVDLYFDLDWNFLFEGTYISSSDLPAAVLTTIENDYSNYLIDDSDVEQFTYPDGTIEYEVELEALNGDGSLEVIFAADGSFICDDESGSGSGGSGSGGSGNGGSLPQSVQDFIQQNYGGYNIESVESEDYCDDVQAYEVELEDGPGPDVDLYFDLDWNFLFAAVEVSPSALPAAVVNAIASEFPGFQVEEDKVVRFELADGSFQYEVELESDDDDVEVVFNADGSIFCLND